MKGSQIGFDELTPSAQSRRLHHMFHVWMSSQQFSNSHHAPIYHGCLTCLRRLFEKCVFALYLSLLLLVTFASSTLAIVSSCHVFSNAWLVEFCFGHPTPKHGHLMRSKQARNDQSSSHPYYCQSTASSPNNCVVCLDRCRTLREKHTSMRVLLE